MFEFEVHLETVRLMHKRGLGDVLGKLVKMSRLYLGNLFGMHSAMDILIGNSTVFANLADNPKKLRFLVWNQAEFERKLQHLDQFVEWLEK